MRALMANTKSAEKRARQAVESRARNVAQRSKARSAVRKVVEAINAGKKARTKAIVEDPLLRVVANFQQSIAVDTIRNEYLFHREIHHWLAQADSSLAIDTLNERVYAELFLTPSNDPWLGLVPDATYTALQNDGRSVGK